MTDKRRINRTIYITKFKTILRQAIFIHLLLKRIKEETHQSKDHLNLRKENPTAKALNQTRNHHQRRNRIQVSTERLIFIIMIV
jgi:hypothetical protein